MFVRAATYAGISPEQKPTKVVDAHSVKAGDFTEPCTVDGKQVWLTPAGAEAWKAIVAEGGYRVSANTDPVWYMPTPDFVKEEMKGEMHRGDPKAKK